jgi:uncharacterized protein (TIGR00297 family)
VALAAAIALLARRARSLSPDGAVAATVVGALAVGAGWGWGALLVAFFVASSVLSRLGAAAKAARTEAIVAKGSERDAWQVLANGGVFALAAAGALLLPHAAWAPFGVGALAAAAADTWGTEIGTLAGRPPRSLRGWRPVPAGTSGAVSAAGTLATVAGAIFVASLALLVGFPVAVVGPAALGGVAGAFADSLLGATVQARRRCPRCERATERIVHGCGERTLAAGGLRWLDNDVVNLLATLAGGLVALLVA